MIRLMSLLYVPISSIKAGSDDGERCLWFVTRLLVLMSRYTGSRRCCVVGCQPD